MVIRQWPSPKKVMATHSGCFIDGNSKFSSIYVGPLARQTIIETLKNGVKYDQSFQRHPGVFIVNLAHSSYLFLMFLLMTLKS